MCTRIAHLDVAGAAAAPHQTGHGFVGDLEQFAAVFLDALFGAAGILDLVEVHLRDHQRFVGLGIEAAANAHDLGGVRRRGDHRGLFHDHRREVIAAVHAYVQAERKGQRIGADDVFDRFFGRLAVEAAIFELMRQLLG